MCGIVGVISPNNCKVDITTLKLMSQQISHRGPDDSGYWVDETSRIGLAHRRLSVIDTTLAGHQPMESISNRYVIVFNGEIYNHSDIRQALELKNYNHNWNGHSDTETLLAGFEVFGIEETIKRAVGMFAFAVWDNNENTLVLGRDRIGEKPLYYGWQGDTFLFGSELKALKQHPAFKTEINRDAITLLLRHNYIPAPYSIYQGISKLEPGCLLSVSTTTKEPKVWPYWSSSDIAVSGVQAIFTGTPDDAVDELERLAKDAVGLQMMADVPLGAFLSGGIDSSAVVALMQAQSTRPVKTFTIGFHEEGYNEAEHAKAVAKHLGTDHTELYVTSEEAMSVIPDLPTLYSEPFSDSSQIPTFLVSKLAKQHVSVSLSGDAGDELFYGYSRYIQGHQMWSKLKLLPHPVRKFIAGTINHLPGTLLENMQQVLPKRTRRYTNRNDRS
mgnify:CR=1 FL=1